MGYRLAVLAESMALVLLLSGCATVRPLATPSGKPEVSISGVSHKDVVDALTNLMLDGGYQVKTVNDYMAVYVKKQESLGAALLFGSRYDVVPEARVSFNLVEVSGQVRIVSSIAMVTNPGSAYESVTDLSVGRDAHEVQRVLLMLKQAMESGVLGVSLDKDMAIYKIARNGPAETGGARVGDRFETINGKRPQNNSEAADLLLGPPGSEIEMVLLRGDARVPLRLVRKPYLEVYGSRSVK